MKYESSLFRSVGPPGPWFFVLTAWASTQTPGLRQERHCRGATQWAERSVRRQLELDQNTAMLPVVFGASGMQSKIAPMAGGLCRSIIGGKVPVR